ncbi:MAG: biotin transporter BioY [Oscillospiraceae bacterium]|jgi:biotin transport system substrate-specific component|nr:biotin transporter BioY [Oscillospiraceae bacterium]
MREKISSGHIRAMALCAIFAAMSAAVSPWTVPIGPVPVGFTHISVFLSAGILGAKKAAVSQAVFVAVGVAGAPVFSGFEGGVGKIVGLTGGFVAGYVLAAFIAGFITERLGYSYPALFLGMYAGWAGTYAVGLAWFMFVSKSGFLTAFALCAAPFIIPDAVKTVICAVLIRRIKTLKIIG